MPEDNLRANLIRVEKLATRTVRVFIPRAETPLKTDPIENALPCPLAHTHHNLFLIKCGWCVNLQLYQTASVTGNGSERADAHGLAGRCAKPFNHFEVRREVVLMELPLQSAALNGNRERHERQWFLRFEMGFRHTGQHFGFRTGDFHEPQHGLVHSGLEAAAQQRQQFVPDAVAQDVARRIAGIFAEAYFFVARELFQLGAAHVQQRTDELDGGINRRRRPPLHSRQTLATTAAQQSEKEQFHLIVRVMRQHNGRKAKPRGGAGEEFVAQFAGRHLSGQPTLFRVRPHVGAFSDALQLQPGGERSHKAFVSHAVASAELVVEVRDCQFPPIFHRQRMQQVEQCHGIQPAGNCHKNPLASTKQLPGADGLFDVFGQVFHVAMLNVHRKREQGDSNQRRKRP